MIVSIPLEDFPVEVLSVIFGCLSFEQLHRNVKFVCKKWYSAVLMDYSHPRSMVVDGRNADMALRKTVLFGPHIRRLKFSNVDSDVILRFFDTRHPFSNLKTLSIVWKWTPLSAACKLSTVSLGAILDQCPELDRLYLKNCFLYDSTGHLAEKIAEKRIRSLSVLNRYQFLDDVDRFYELQNMKELRISSGCSAETIQRICQTSGATLTSLGVHIDAWSNRAQGENVLGSVAACFQLVKLHLAVSTPHVDLWTDLANLSKLRCLSVEVNRTPTKALIGLFGRLGPLQSLKVRWNRRADVDELTCLNGLQLRHLSLAFAEDVSDAESCSLLAAVANLVAKNYSLRELRVETYFYDVDLVGWLCRAATTQLRRVKISQICRSLNENRVRDELQRVSNFISFAYGLEYTVTNESILEIVVRKKM